jgi:hypothetical protein
MSVHQEILDTVQRYFESIYSGDVARLRSTFHPQAALFGEVKGQPYYKSLDDYLDAVAKRQSPQALGEDFLMKATSVDVLGPIGLVRTHCQMLGFNYVDYLSLVRSDGRWLIVNKTFTHVET